MEDASSLVPAPVSSSNSNFHTPSASPVVPQVAPSTSTKSTNYDLLHTERLMLELHDSKSSLVDCMKDNARLKHDLKVYHARCQSYDNIIASLVQSMSDYREIEKDFQLLSESYKDNITSTMSQVNDLSASVETSKNENQVLLAKVLSADLLAKFVSLIDKSLIFFRVAADFASNWSNFAFPDPSNSAFTLLNNAMNNKENAGTAIDANMTMSELQLQNDS